MSHRSREREHAQRQGLTAQQIAEANRMVAQAQAIDPESDMVCVFRSTIPEIEKIYALKRDMVGTPVPGGLMITIKNPKREGSMTPFTKQIEIFGAFATEILEKDPDWWTREKPAEKPAASNIIQMG